MFSATAVCAAALGATVVSTAPALAAGAAPGTAVAVPHQQETLLVRCQDDPARTAAFRWTDTTLRYDNPCTHQVSVRVDTWDGLFVCVRAAPGRTGTVTFAGSGGIAQVRPGC